MTAISEALERVQAAAKEEAAGDDPVAHVRLLNEISALRDAAETPAERLMRIRFHHMEDFCIRVALEYGVLQAIAAKKGASVPAAELAKETGADELLVVRMMRSITHACVADETGPASYASNATTELITTPGGIGGQKHHSDLTFPVGSKLVEMIRKGKLFQFPDEPGQISPFEYTFGMPLFKYLQHDREQKEAFDDYMSIRRAVNAPQWFETYPAREMLSKGPKIGEGELLVVDVGGGAGHEISKFREKNGDLPGRLVLQDLPETFKNISSGLEGVEVMPHDFFNEQPVKGARIYYLRQIMHDWSDKNCEAILSNIVKAMDPNHSRLLIDDYVLPDTGADRRAAGMDFLMFMFVQGMERSRGQWKSLVDRVGLEIVKIWQTRTGLECVIETKVKS